MKTRGALHFVHVLLRLSTAESNHPALESLFLVLLPPQSKLMWHNITNSFPYVFSQMYHFKLIVQ